MDRVILATYVEAAQALGQMPRDIGRCRGALSPVGGGKSIE